MTQWDKLIERIKSLSDDVRFDELQKILESYGYKMKAPKHGSSHHTFRKAGKPAVTIPRHKSIKKVYVAMVNRIVEEEEQEKQKKIEEEKQNGKDD